MIAYEKVMASLIIVQLLVLIIETVIVVLEFSGCFVVKMIIHSFICSVKLEIEFVVLDQPIAISRLGTGGIPPDLESCSPNPGTAAPVSTPTLTLTPMSGFHQRKHDTSTQFDFNLPQNYGSITLNKQGTTLEGMGKKRVREAEEAPDGTHGLNTDIGNGDLENLSQELRTSNS
jgi:hypothetical protein